MKKTLIIAMVLIASLNLKAQDQIKGKVVEQMEDGTEVPRYKDPPSSHLIFEILTHIDKNKTSVVIITKEIFLKSCFITSTKLQFIY